MKTSFVLVAVLLLLHACSGSDASRQEKEETVNIVYNAPAPRQLSAADSARLHQSVALYYDSILAPRGFNGSILIAKNGHVVFEKYAGWFNLLRKDSSIDTHSAFHLASVSKTFTAMGILKLAELNKLNIADSLTRYFPNFPYAGVTVRSLLNHRSGLPNYTHFMDDTTYWPDKKRFVTNADVLEVLINKKPPVNFAPDSHFSYSNTNYALLALLIEKVTGKSFSWFMQNYFFKPLQMHDSYVFALADTNRAMPSYDWKGRPMEATFLDAAYGDKNIYSTVRDLLKWDEALKSGQLFSAATLAAAYQPYSNERPGIKNYGLGWRMYNMPNGKQIIYHNGWWRGNNTAFARLVADDAVIIILGNKFNRGIYSGVYLSGLFGDYGLKMEDTEEGADSLVQKQTQDSLRRKPAAADSLPQRKQTKKRR